MLCIHHVFANYVIKEPIVSRIHAVPIVSCIHVSCIHVSCIHDASMCHASYCVMHVSCILLCHACVMHPAVSCIHAVPSTAAVFPTYKGPLPFRTVAYLLTVKNLPLRQERNRYRPYLLTAEYFLLRQERN
jgi:hypothetical protein